MIVELMSVGCQLQNNEIYAYDLSQHCNKIQIAIADYRCSFRLSFVLAGQSRTSHLHQHKLCNPRHEHERTILPNIIDHVYCIQIELVVVVVVSTKADREWERDRER